MDFLDIMMRVGVALGLGLLVGLSASSPSRRNLDQLFAGTRTFSLIGVRGAATGNTAVEAVIVWVTGSGGIKKAILPGAPGAILTPVAIAFLL